MSGDLLGGEETRSALQAAEHEGCCVCGASDSLGLGLVFLTQDDRSVVATLPCDPWLRSYRGFLHGGVISTVLDAAMTHALFASGVVGVTAELTVRFLAPVKLGRAATVRASVVCSRSHGLHLLQALLEQDGAPRARATARFLARPPP
jgi:uncharacterized protein (TIGR00369 family)